MKKTEKEKMLAGDLYDAMDPELVAGRHRARLLLAQLNNSGVNEDGQHALIISDLIPS